MKSHQLFIGMMLTLITAFFFGTPAYGGSGNGTISLIATSPAYGPSKAGVAFIVLNNANPSPPACDTYDTHRFVVDLGTPGGQAIYSQALAAKLNGQSVSISGTGDCATWGDTEGILYFFN